MKTEFHFAVDRGYAKHPWLETYHSFSFADYYNPKRDGFGKLRVLNDDIIEADTGFGTHPHNNMEIITIPLSGILKHTDSMGHTETIQTGEVQVMSAGTGIMHSEYNGSNSDVAAILQIWIFPRSKGLAPRYDQKEIASSLLNNSLQLLVTPDTQQTADTLWIYQDAWISRGVLNENQDIEYKIKRDGNGLFLFVINGLIAVEYNQFTKRDAVAISETNFVRFQTLEKSDVLLIDVPMGL